MSDEIDVVDALDMYATTTSNGVSIHMDGDRDAEMWVEGPEDGGEVHDDNVYRITLTGEQNGVSAEIGFFVDVETFEELIDDG